MLTPSFAAGANTAALEARLRSYAPLNPTDLKAIRDCSEDLRTTTAGAEILPSDALRAHPRLVASGWAAAVRTLKDGRRQILRIYLPGDVIGVSPIASGPVVALSTVLTTDAHALAVALLEGEGHEGLRAAWERAQATRQQELLDHIVRLGRLSAYERTGHLLVELLGRHRRAGLSDGRRMPWPVTQDTLSDVLGLSVVHVNRVLQQLRREGMIALRSGQLQVPDVERLAAVCSWEANLG